MKDRKLPAGRKKRPLDETDLANERMGNNRLQGNDQGNMQNQRSAWPDTKPEPDADVVETFGRMEQGRRARADLGKGAKDGK